MWPLNSLSGVKRDIGVGPYEMGLLFFSPVPMVLQAVFSVLETVRLSALIDLLQRQFLMVRGIAPHSAGGSIYAGPRR